MQFTDAEVNGLIDAWEADFGQRLSPDEARSQLSRLMHFFSTIAREFYTRPNAESRDVPGHGTIAT